MIGIDPGLKLGLAILDPEKPLNIISATAIGQTDTHLADYDRQRSIMHGVAAYLDDKLPASARKFHPVVAIEKPFSSMAVGNPKTFGFQQQLYGVLRVFLRERGFEITEVHVASWRAAWKLPKKKDKPASIARVHQLTNAKDVAAWYYGGEWAKEAISEAVMIGGYAAGLPPHVKTTPRVDE